MDLDNLKIGGRIKHARLVKKIRLKQLSKKIGCSESLLSKIENGRTQPSLQTLHRLTNALDISISKLFSDDGSINDRFFMKADERPSIELGEKSKDNPDIRLESIIPHSSPNLLTANIHIVAPGAATDGHLSSDNNKIGTIQHLGEEVGYILSGQIELMIDGKILFLEEGDSFFFESHLKHGYRNPGPNKTRILWVNTPPTF